MHTVGKFYISGSPPQTENKTDILIQLPVEMKPNSTFVVKFQKSQPKTSKSSEKTSDNISGFTNLPVFPATSHIHQMESFLLHTALRTQLVPLDHQINLNVTTFARSKQPSTSTKLASCQFCSVMEIQTNTTNMEKTKGWLCLFQYRTQTIFWRINEMQAC